jgi:muramoyltetrapeptide carboxypeptidase
MDIVQPRPLRPGDMVRVIAPALSGRRVTVDTALARQRFHDLGLEVSFGQHVNELDALGTSAIEARVDDLHEAFRDPDVAAIMTLIGGYTTNELLPSIDWRLIARYPKVFCGYSDASAFELAALRRTGLVTYYGPHWSTFAMRDGFDQTLSWFKQAVCTTDQLALHPADTWSDDAWYVDQDEREWLTTDGPWIMHHGQAAGQAVCAHLNTLLTLAGTPYLPELAGRIVMVEASGDCGPANFARDLAALLQLPGSDRIAGLGLGRFQRASEMSRETLAVIATRHRLLSQIPLVANLDFGHTSPMSTLPVGAQLELDTTRSAFALFFERQQCQPRGEA